jgi:hypothetical protein
MHPAEGAGVGSEQSNVAADSVLTPQQAPMSTALAQPWLLVPGSAHRLPFSARQATCSS